MTKPILTAVTGTNADLIANVTAMYLADGMRVLDVTFGKGAFWSKVDLSRFDFVPSDLMNGVDFTDLPYPDSTADVVVLDPPYMHGGATIKDSINKCYRNENTSHESVIRLYTGGILEAARVLKKRGLLLLKCQDEIESGVQRLSSHELRGISEMLGFKVKDLFVLLQVNTPTMREQYQKSARKNHSYLFVMEFRR